jgi:hypothetical protein
MNNTTTKRNIALAAVFMAATLVVGTFAVTTTVQSAFAYSQKKDNGKGNGNGNTVTIEECKNKGSASGFDTAVDQECENLICTHPGNNSTCVQEGAVAAAVQQGNQTTPVKLTCAECFRKFLTADQITIVVSSQANPEQLCTGLGPDGISETVLINQLNLAKVSETIQAQLIQCLIDAGVPFEPLIV